ncbi:MAG: double zinc ribbon domain-containing protein [Candidatus Competibacteraceae bacterium]
MMFGDALRLVNRQGKALAQRWLRQLQQGLLPTCLLCGLAGADGRDLCVGCTADLPHNTPACERCAQPLAAAGQSTFCTLCQSNLQETSTVRSYLPLTSRPSTSWYSIEIPRSLELWPVAG